MRPEFAAFTYTFDEEAMNILSSLQQDFAHLRMGYLTVLTSQITEDSDLSLGYIGLIACN